MSRRWTIFWIIWITCFLPVVWSLRPSDSDHASGRKSIAMVEKIEGSVTVRTESQMTWQKVKANQALYNNDLLSTENKSRVSIVFTNGRKLQLTPGSVVKLGLPSPLSKDTEVSVLKGRLFVKAEDPKNAADGKVENAGEVILKNRNEKVFATSKQMDFNSKDETPKPQPSHPNSLAANALAMANSQNPNPQGASVSLDALRNLNLNGNMKLSALAPPPIVEKCEPPPEPEIEAKEEEKLDLPSFQANLVPKILPLGGEFWTSEPMDQVTDKVLRLEIDTPTNLPSDIRDSWKGIVNISGPNGNIRIDGKAAAGKKKLSISLKDLMAAQVIKDMNQTSFAVNAGYSIESESFSDAIEHSAPTTSVYSLRSLADGEGIMIGFDKLLVSNSPNPWFFVNPKPNNRIWIGVTEAQDRRKLFNIVQGNGGQASRSDWPGLPAKGVYIVRKDKIVGIVNGRDITAAEWNKIRTTFNADLIFRGSGTSYIRKADFDATQTNERTLYVLNRGEFVQIDVSLLRSRPKSMSYLKGVSNYIFREQPEILSIAR